MTCLLSAPASPASVNFSDSLQYLTKPQASGAELHTAGKGAQQGVAEPQVRLQRPSRCILVTAALVKLWSLEFPEQSATHHCFYKPGVTKALPYLAMGRTQWDGAGQGQQHGLAHSRYPACAVLFLSLSPILLPPLPLLLVGSCSAWEFSTSSWPLNKIEFLLL